METQLYSYLGGTGNMPMRDPGAEAFAFQKAGNALQENINGVGRSAERLVKYQQDMNHIQDIQNGLDFETKANEIIGEYKKKISKSPMAFDRHAEWMQKAMSDISALNYGFSDTLSASKFEARKRGLITDFNVGAETGIYDGRLNNLRRSSDALIKTYTAEKNYGAANQVAQEGVGVIYTQEEANLKTSLNNMEARLESCQEVIAKDPRGSLQKVKDALQGKGEWKGLSIQEAYTLENQCNRELSRRQDDSYNVHLTDFYEGKPLDRLLLDEQVKSGEIEAGKALVLKKNDDLRAKNAAVFNPAVWDSLSRKIAFYDPESDSDNKTRADLRQSVALSGLPDEYQKQLARNLNERVQGLNKDATSILRESYRIADDYDDVGQFGNALPSYMDGADKNGMPIRVFVNGTKEKYLERRANRRKFVEDLSESCKKKGIKDSEGIRREARDIIRNYSSPIVEDNDVPAPVVKADGKKMTMPKIPNMRDIVQSQRKGDFDFQHDIDSAEEAVQVSETDLPQGGNGLEEGLLPPKAGDFPEVTNTVDVKGRAWEDVENDGYAYAADNFRGNDVDDFMAALKERYDLEN